MADKSDPNQNIHNEDIPVVRRQKKPKIDTLNPKKRVSFHDDILNSTKIDDIHINRGLITYLPKGANKKLLEKQGIVIGRCFSWSINDDNEESLVKIERETQSDLFPKRCRDSDDSGFSSECTTTTSSSTSSSLYTFPNFSNLKKNRQLSERPHSDSSFFDKSLVSSTGHFFGSLKTLWYSTKTGINDGNYEHEIVEVQEAHEELKLRDKVIRNTTFEHKGVTYSEEYEKFQQEFHKEIQSENEKNTVLSFYRRILKNWNIFRYKKVSDSNQCQPIINENLVTSCQDLVIDASESVDNFEITKNKKRVKKGLSKSNRNSLLVFDNNHRQLLSDVNKKINSEIDHELFDNNEQGGCSQKRLSKEIQEILKCPDEQIIKIYKIWTSNSTPELLILTNSSINFVLITCDPLMTVSSFNFLLNDLYSILIGPNNYWILLSNESGDTKRFFFMLSKQTTENFMQQLEIELRKKSYRLPVFRQLNFMDNNDMKQLWNFVRNYRDLTRAENEQSYFFYYGIVRIHCFNHQFETCCTSGSGMDLSFVSFPTKEGALMFQIGDQKNSWDTGYFILKGGILYIFSSTSNSLPLICILLASGRCEMIKRVEHPQRPHTFELIYDGTTYLMAAPDEFVTNEWLQALIESVSSGYNSNSSFQQNSVLSSTEICTILLTGTFIVLVRENVYQCQIEKKPYEIIACANLSDLISLQLPSKKDESWCILEFECQEVLENSGDWILYFGADDDMMEFFNLLEILWNAEASDRFPLETVDESKKMYSKCVKTFRYLKNDLWPKTLASFYY